MAKNNKITVKFNNQNHVFDKASLARMARKAVLKSAPRDASNLKHMARIPGVKVPVSLNWAMLHIFGTPSTLPSVVSENKKGIAQRTRGAYHPRQAMSALTHLAPLGVKVASVAESASYTQWSNVARKAAAKTTRKAKK